MYQFKNNKLPKIFDNFYLKNSDIHSHHTRARDHFCLINTKLNIRKFSMKYNGAKIWNSIPCEIQNAKSLGIFKSQLKKHLLRAQTSSHIT